jgi:hypothetical protein
MGTLKTAALGFAALLAGCGGPSSQPFNPQSEAIKTIALITVPDPSQYQAVDWGGKASLFGAVGGVATQADATTMSLALSTAAKEANFEYSREMQTAVADRLTRAGFKVVAVTAKREAPEKLLSDYSQVPAGGADALLDVDARTVGYSSYNIQDPDLRPHVHVDVRLVSAKTRAVLYSEQILFGYHNPYMSATQLPSERQYYFKDFGTLMGDRTRALQGIRSGTQAIADHIAKRLTPAP